VGDKEVSICSPRSPLFGEPPSNDDEAVDDVGDNGRVGIYWAVEGAATRRAPIL
jgi:hypothetical protein